MRGFAVAAAAAGGRARVILRVWASIAALSFPGCALADDAILPGHRVLFWGLVLLASFAGWGSLVARWIGPKMRADIGLRLVWGVSLVLAIGGMGCLLSLATRGVLVAIVAVGLAALGWHAWTSERDTIATRRPPGTTVVLLCAAALIGIQYCGGVTGFQLTPDDTISYFPFAQEIDATGTLLQPFSLRRMAAYGGQSLLQAFVLIGASNPLQLSSLDVGISLIIVVALLLGGRTRSPLGLWLTPLLLLLSLPDMRANTTSLMSGVALFLGLYRTAIDPFLRRHPRRRAAIIGLVAGAACTLRHSNLPAAATFVALIYAPDLIGAWRGPSRSRRRALLPAVCVVTTLASLACWIVLSVQACGTPLYPLLPGHVRADAGNYTVGSLGERLAFLWTNMTYRQPVRSVPLFLIAALTVPWRSTAGALSAIAWASAIGFVAICWGFPTSDPFNIARYYFGFVVAMVLAVSLHVCATPLRALVSLPMRMRVPALLTLAAIAWQLVAIPSEAYTTYRDLLAGIQRPAWMKPAYMNQEARTLAAQSSAPAGEPLLVMLDQTFWLDFHRNPIHSLDMPGQVGPPPGFSLDDDDSFVAYLASLGIRYIVFVKPTASDWSFRRSRWGWLAESLYVPLWRVPAQIIVKFFDRLDSLTLSRTQLYNDGKFVTLDLARRP